MRDLIFLATVVVFFAVAVAYVRACGSIVGRTDPASPAGEVADAEDDISSVTP